MSRLQIPQPPTLSGLQDAVLELMKKFELGRKSTPPERVPKAFPIELSTRIMSEKVVPSVKSMNRQTPSLLKMY